MLFNVPQFIDIEDKIVGPLTAKQLGWLAIGGIATLISYSLLDKSTFIIFFVIIVIVFSALAFYRPYNQPLIKFITSSIFFITRPKMYVWRRIAEKTKEKERKQQISIQPITRKSFDAKKASDISQILDKNR